MTDTPTEILKSMLRNLDNINSEVSKMLSKLAVLESTKVNYRECNVYHNQLREELLKLESKITDLYEKNEVTKGEIENLKVDLAKIIEDFKKYDENSALISQKEKDSKRTFWRYIILGLLALLAGGVGKTLAELLLP